MNEEFWLASHPDNGAEPVHTVGGDIGVVHTAGALALHSCRRSLSGSGAGTPHAMMMGIGTTMVKLGPATS